MKLSRPAVAAVVLLVALLLSVPTTAVAATKAKAQSKSVQTTSARWGAVSTSQGGAASPGEEAEVEIKKNKTVAYFDIVNVGTERISGQLLKAETFAYDANGNSKGMRDPSQTYLACQGGKWESGKCKGTQVQFVWDKSTRVFTSGVPLNPGERVTVRITHKTQDNKYDLVTTVKVSVSTDHIRSATVTNN